jgi:glycosyltransferase involved in cell wall biosynthesis
LLFPIDWPELFGLVMIESMACGTPVIAFRRGSVPEVVEHGMSGFVVNGEADAVSALARINDLNRHHVRQAFERRFTARRMTDNYVRTYEKLLDQAFSWAAAASYATSADGRHRDNVRSVPNIVIAAAA